MSLSIISPTGRAFMAELSKLPDDQAKMQKISQSVGTVPFMELVSMKMELDRMKQAAPQQQQPQGKAPTVADEMRQQLAAHQQGLASMPVSPQMFQPQHMAGGGIVSFAEGGMPTEQIPLDFTGPRSAVPGDFMSAEEAGAAQAAGEAVEEVAPGIFKRAAGGIRGLLTNPYVGGKLPLAVGALRAAKTLTGNGPDITDIARYYGISTDPQTESVYDPTLHKYVTSPAAQKGPITPGQQFESDIALRAMDAAVGMGSLGFAGAGKGYAAAHPTAPPTAGGGGGGGGPPPPAELPPLPPLSASSTSYGAGYGARMPDDSAIRKELAAGPGNADQAAIDAAMAARYKAMNIGAGAEDYAKVLAQRGKDAGTERAKDRRDALTQFFFNWAAQSAQPGATALGAAAQAAPALGKAGHEAELDYRKATNAVEDATFQLSQAQDKVKMGELDAGGKEYQEAQQRLEQAHRDRLDAETRIYGVKGGIAEAQIREQGITKANLPAQQALVDANRAWQAWQSLPKKDPLRPAAEERYNQYMQHAQQVAGSATADSTQNRQEAQARTQAMQILQMDANFMTAEPQIKAQMVAELAQRLLNGHGGQAPAGGVVDFGSLK